TLARSSLPSRLKSSTSTFPEDPESCRIWPGENPPLPLPLKICSWLLSLVPTDSKTTRSILPSPLKLPATARSTAAVVGVNSGPERKVPFRLFRSTDTACPLLVIKSGQPSLFTSQVSSLSEESKNPPPLAAL